MAASLSTQLSRLTLPPSSRLHNNTTLRLSANNPPFILRTSFLHQVKSAGLCVGRQQAPSALNSLWGTDRFSGVARAAYNVQIVVGENEPEESLLRRFRREVSRAGIIKECKRRRFFENQQDVKKRKAREAGRRNRRKRPAPPKPSPSTLTEDSSLSKLTPDDEDDNWDLPEGDLPY